MNTNTKIAIGVGVALFFGYALGSSGNEQTVQETTPTETTETYEEVVEKYESEVVEQVKTEPKKATINDMFVKGDDFSIDITDVKTEGGDLIVEYDYTNESEEEQTPIWHISIKGYQDGVELSQSYKGGNYKDQKTILAGYDIEGLEERAILENDNDPIVIKVVPWIDFADTVFAEFEYNPQTGEVVRCK